MDLFEERVFDRVREIRDPVERLRSAIRGHVLLVTRDRPKQITVVLNEATSVHGDYKSEINRRKRRYIRFLSETFRELIKKDMCRPIDPRIATFALLGMINWIYQWYTPEGRISDTELAEAYIDIFLGGVLKPEYLPEHEDTA